ncbi:hypothetical protein [Bacillus mycoides]|uniref:hypothetical protein n=1 Tax=Bacillus mycoides TaxID=1405 RepID=UPI00065C16DC|nr:hypothetical protein [Bacillus mycoides]KMQ18158.1 hypothetical protein TU70_10705 [Bacillus mycoides]
MADASQHFKSVQSRKEPKPMGLANSLFPSSNVMKDASQHLNSFQQKEKEKDNNRGDFINKILNNSQYRHSTFHLK